MFTIYRLIRLAESIPKTNSAHRSFDVDYYDIPVLATMTLKLKAEDISRSLKQTLHTQSFTSF